MRSSWHVGIVILTLVGLSGCAGVQQRGRSTSPMEGLSTEVPGRPGWPTRLFRWRFASAEPRIETTRRAARTSAVAPETDIWPDRSRGVLSRLLTSFPSRAKAAGAGSSILSRRESSPSSGELTVAEANAAIARAARPRTTPATAPATRDPLVLTARGEATADEPAEAPELDAPPLLATPIPLPGDDAANETPDSASTIEPDAILTQAPPPPPLRPTPRPAELRPEPEPEPIEITPPVEPVKPEPEPEPIEVAPPAEPVKPEPEPARPIEPTKPAEPARPIEPETKPVTEAPEPSAAPSPFQESPAPFAAAQEPRSAPVVAAPQVYLDSPGAAPVPAPLRPHEDAPRRWSFWSWKKAPSHGGGFPIETSAQLPAVQFPASYDSIAARPLTPSPDYARVVTPTAQQQVMFPSAQIVETASVEKCWRIKALGARLHDKLERLRAWKHEHICKHIQNLKAALKGGKCLGCGLHAESIAQPLASPQSASVLGTSRFGLY